VTKGHRPDTRKRGGLIFEKKGAETVVGYHCFNCGAKARWNTQRPPSRSFLEIAAAAGIRPEELSRFCGSSINLPEFSPRPMVFSLPENSVLVQDCPFDDPPEAFIKAVEYGFSRHEDLFDWSPFYWSSSFPAYLILPSYGGPDGKIVGWVGRLANGEKNSAKYFSQHHRDTLFNSFLLYQPYRKTIPIVEGPFDAISIRGCALLSNTITDKQLLLLRKQNARPIVFPDRDKAGLALAEAAERANIDVGYLDMPDGCKDVFDFVKRTNRLHVVREILRSAEQSSPARKIAKRQFFKGIA
jgi:hypothetical protein